MTKIHLLLLICVPLGVLQAAIFGDGTIENGIEDSRISIIRSASLGNLNYVGTVFCDEKARGSAILLSVTDENRSARPFLLTAAHVLLDASGEALDACGYRSRANPWESKSLTGEFVSGAYSGEAAIGRFIADWTVVGIDPWAGWEHQAVPFSLMVDTPHVFRQSLENESAIFVGYDTASNQLLVDEECVFGYQTALGAEGKKPDLIWDNCDSESGSSGGALFEATDKDLRLIAIRVGNLFDADIYPEGPQQGDRFDLDANINVGRLINQDIRSAIESLMSD